MIELYIVAGAAKYRLFTAGLGFVHLGLFTWRSAMSSLRGRVVFATIWRTVTRTARGGAGRSLIGAVPQCRHELTERYYAASGWIAKSSQG